ncbi:MAG TPA: hypothetical protein VE196_13535 [Pseudonocardiaceae bacterium]|nr:hypothetical protein [Pseudonocardiaceae bacterium]
MIPVHVRSRTASVVLALAGMLLALAAATGTASASSNAATGTATRSSSTASTHPDFSAQATSLGLTSAQAKTLQVQVNGYLSKLGGTQVAINKINLNDKGYVLFPLPGKKAAAANFCNLYYFCAYSQPDFNGIAINMYACSLYSIPFKGTGSWANNQTKGTQARMYDTTGKLIYTTPGAYSGATSGDWTPVTSVRNCP